MSIKTERHPKIDVKTKIEKDCSIRLMRTYIVFVLVLIPIAASVSPTDRISGTNINVRIRIDIHTKPGGWEST